MATFTIQLRHVDELYNVRKSALSQYPLFDEEYREGLNQKILDHFWLREIAHETPDIFLFILRRKMNEIMPYFNQLYMSERLEYDPLSTLDMRTIARDEGQNKATQSGSGSSESVGTADSRGVNSDYPASILSGSEDYATSGADSKATTTGKDSNESTSEAQSATRSIGDSHAMGRTQAGASLVMEYRQALLNVDMEIIALLEPLFMGIFMNSDFEPAEPNYNQFPAYFY